MSIILSEVNYTNTLHHHLIEHHLRSEKAAFKARWDAQSYRPTNLSDLAFIKTIAIGFYGPLMLSKHKNRGSELFVVKMAKKEFLEELNQTKNIQNEVRMMHAMRSPFCVKLEYFLVNRVYVIFVMPYLSGGDFLSYLHKEVKFNENRCRFYAAQIVLALEYMHAMGLVYRDIKPENIMLSHNGYIQIIDFGMAKKIDQERTYSLCGTPEYLAPEMILIQGYDKSVDWWSFGILLFELAAGYTPFVTADPMEMYRKILDCKYEFPSHFSDSLKHLLRNILVLDRCARLGNLRNGPNDIKNHKWYASFNWTAVLCQMLTPEFVPNVSEQTDHMAKHEEVQSKDKSIDMFRDHFLNYAVTHYSSMDPEQDSLSVDNTRSWRTAFKPKPLPFRWQNDLSCSFGRRQE